MTNLSHKAITCGLYTTSSPFWQHHDEDLRHAASAGLTTTEVANILGVSKNAVISRAQRIDIVWARSPEIKMTKATPPRMVFPPPGCCVFITGDPREAASSFCGEEVVEYGHPYCAKHHLLCYRPQLPLKIKE